MAPITAFCFSLPGVAILLSTGLLPKLASRINGAWGSLILGLGLVALLAYWLELESPYGWGRLTYMAIHTAFGFIVLGLGLSLIAWKMDRAADKELPRWLPVPAAVVVLTIACSLWQALHPDRDIMAVRVLEILFRFLASR